MIATRKPRIDLDTISDEELLNARLCDLPVCIEGTWLEECINQLYQELEEKGINFRPVCYLADEWLTPQRETCIGIPFYLAHPTLIRLEKKMMMEAEGEGKQWCMKLLRHEAGHAISYAYRLHTRKKWQRIFGPPSKEYGDFYKYRPYSKNFVRHLDGFYAQYHPEEDFVETFAVWLTPGLDWQERYNGWKALEKLKYVDRLMEEIKGKEAPVKRSERFWRVPALRYTLKTYYKRKKHEWEEDLPDFHDQFLRQLFKEPNSNNSKAPTASQIMQKYHSTVLNSVYRTSGERKYIINDLLKGMRKRSRSLKLMAVDDESAVAVQIASYITALMMNYSYTGRFRGNKDKKR